MTARRLAPWAIAAVGAAASVVLADTRDVAHAGHALGQVEFPVSCSARAQGKFSEAVALLHHMTYPQAREAFQQVADAEPQCAMAHWGIAITLFQPLWPTRPGPEALRRGAAEVRVAQSLAPPTERERLFLAAAAAFFDESAPLTYWQRIGRWKVAMEKLHVALPQDPEATVFYALSLLATAPSDSSARDAADSAAALLLQVYERHPDHPGAMHYLVHANDVPGREHELLEVVRKYETVAPRNPHALHMPTHIFTRLGDWPAVIRGNLLAADAALEYPAGERGEYVWDEFPHAIEYLVYAYLQQGDDQRALVQLRRLQATARLEPTFKTAFHLSSTPARYVLERREWHAALALVPRTPATLDWDQFTWPEAVTWFARGLGATHAGQLDIARAAEQRLGELETATAASGEVLFTRNIRVLRWAVGAWLAQVQGEGEAARTMMKQAADLEAATPKHAVTPAPTLPASELLGDLLREQGEPVLALAAYQRSLELYPQRFNSLLGAARAARAAGDAPRARDYYQRLLALAGGGTRRSIVDEARLFVAAAPVRDRMEARSPAAR